MASGNSFGNSSSVTVSDEVETALDEGRPVVALESTIFSHLGLPSPHNEEALHRSIAAVRESGAVPAVTAVLDGVARAGLDVSEHPRILGEARKAAARDVSVAIGQRWPVGATTVSGSLLIAERAGIAVFATGGIGGVHRGAADTGDVSADLDAIGTTQAVTVTAGAKAFLDLPRTLEYLETASVPVLGWRTDEFPAFYSRTSGLHLQHRVETAAEVAAVASAHWDLNPGAGLLLAAPIPPEAEIPASELDQVIADSVAAADAAGLDGPALTPFILGHIATATEGRSIPANLALAEHNARVAGTVAAALAVSGA